MPQPSGQPRQPLRRTSRRVHLVDRAAGVIISVFGLTVVAAVLGICVYLTLVAGKLFLPGSAGAPVVIGAAGAGAPRAVLPHDALFVQPDEHQTVVAALLPTGEISIVELSDGREIARARAVEAPAALTAWSRAAAGGATALGFADGTVSIGAIAFETEFLTSDPEADEANKDLAPGQSRAFRDGVVARTPIGQLRLARLRVTMSAPVAVETGAGAVVRIDYRSSSSAEFLLVLREDGELVFSDVRKTTPLGGGTPRVSLTSRQIDFQPPTKGSAPDWLFVSGDGACAYAIWRDGLTQRYTTAEIDNPAAALVETTRVVDQGRSVASAAMMIGALTLAIGDDRGGVYGRFAARDPSAGTIDGLRLAQAHTLASHDGPVVSIRASERDRTFVSADARSVIVHNMTSEKEVARATLPDGAPDIVSAAPAPKNDAVIALSSDGSLTLWPVDPGHPEATVGSLFGKVWYEGEREPSHVYQSSSGDDAAEPKLSLAPLIWGTLKATIYAMLVATPIAIFGAIYTSEFLSRRSRAIVKPVIETMASLPSVVLGFVAAIVLAPRLASALPGVLLAFVAVPIVALLAAHVWQFLPPRVGVAWGDRLRALILTALVAITGVTCVLIGPGADRALFAAAGFDGSLRTWLDTGRGPAWPGWLILAFPACCIAFSLLSARLLDPLLARRETMTSVRAAAALEMVKFTSLLGLSAAGAWALAHALQGVGLDPRHSIFGVFDQRNTLVVSLVMAVAIVPIIYTISEDAMSAVPEPLRSASLAAGATRWQTAVRVVLPVAASGVFSACMIGLGRAAGETMVVLMATGNTPVMSWSIFDGLRSLSANIAVELPEAPKDSTHYRVLFLCGLVLFAVTFAVNSAAELLRQRVRRRTAGL